MRKLIYFVPLIFLLNGTMQAQQYVQVEGRNFKYNDSIFYPLVCNFVVTLIYNPSNPDESYFGGYNGVNWGTKSVCEASLYNDFLEIKNRLKFNTLRIMGMNVSYIDSVAPAGLKRVACLNYNYDSRYPYNLTSPYETDTNTQRYFHFVDRVLEIADSAGLKIIYMTGANQDTSTTSQFYTPYLEFLGALSRHIKNVSSPQAQHAMFAYDLFNEPATGNSLQAWPNSASYHKKSFVCNAVSQWYDTLKHNDPNHLVTLGGHGFTDVYEWDIASLKLDFFSPHMYPIPMSYEDSAHRFPYMMKRIYGNMYWLQNNCPMPWIIGETGFTAQTGLNYPNVDGSLANQLSYAENSLLAVKKYGGSGYSWWQYQNVYWGDPHQDYFGLLDYGETSPSLERPVASAFQNFNKDTVVSTGSMPDNFYDPDNHGLYNTVTSTYNTGRVQDLSGNPIKDAVVGSWTLIANYDSSGVNHPFTNSHYTFTDSSGNFTVIPLDVGSVTSPRPNYIVDMIISATGSDRIHTGWNYPIVNDSIYNLNRFEFKYDGNIYHRNINTNTPTLLSAWNTLTLRDSVIIGSTASGEIKARNEVHLLPGFEAHAGSEVHIYNAETYADCPCYYDLTRKSNILQVANILNLSIESKDVRSEIELDFKLQKGDFAISAYPNPSSGNFSIEINSDDDINRNYNVVVYNASGSQINQMNLSESKFIIDLSMNSPGLYYLKVFNDKHSKIFKLINL